MKDDFDKKEGLFKKPRVIASFDEMPKTKPYKKFYKKQQQNITLYEEEIFDNEEGFQNRIRGQVLRLEKIRQKRKIRFMRKMVLFFIVFCAVVAYFTGVYGESVAFLGDAVSAIRISLTPGAYPAPLALPGFLTAQSMQSSYAVLGEQDLKIYSNSGREIQRIQHNYAMPAISTGTNRVVLYNRGGNRFTVYNGTRMLFEQRYQDPILDIVMSDSGMMAVFRKSALTVYTPTLEQVFEWKTSKMPSAMAFAKDNEHFAVGVPKSVQGRLGGEIYLYTAKLGEPEQAQAVIESAYGVPISLKYLDTKRILAIYHTYAAIYDTKTGDELAKYDYASQTLQSFHTNGKEVFLLFGDGRHSTTTKLYILDETLQKKKEIALGFLVKKMVSNQKGIYFLLDHAVQWYSTQGEFLSEKILDEQINGMLLLKQKVLVFTQTQIQELKFSS